MEKQVACVVVTYNRKELLKESIEALKKQSYENLKILIINILNICALRLCFIFSNSI